jgi:organic hydroperoxide reductase OsmC/OhrA
MPQFPIEYEVELGRGDTSPLALHRGERPVIRSGPPPEFGGTDAWWSPEHLLVSAVSTCYASTLFAMAERAHVHIGSFQCRAKGTLERTAAGVAFTSFHLAIHLRVIDGEAERAQKLVGDAKRHCFVANSLRCPVNVAAEIGVS